MKNWQELGKYVDRSKEVIKAEMFRGSLVS